MTSRTWTRREVLRALVAGGAGLALSGCASTSPGRVVEKASSVPAAGRGRLEDIEHVVVLIQENRSFDHYFGMFPGVDGFGRHLTTDPRALGPFAQPDPLNRARPPVGYLLPYHLDAATGDGSCVNDPSHGWAPQHESWAGGAMDRFVEVHTRPDVDGPAVGPIVMGYYEEEDLPFHYALARAFTLCDAYHCSVIGPTDPNRLYSIAATIDPEGGAGGPWTDDASSATAIGSLRFSTIFDQLESAGVSWRCYQDYGPAGLPSSPLAYLVTNNMLVFFSRFVTPGTPRYEKAFTSTVLGGDFRRDVEQGSLPAVSWLFAPLGVDEHPPAPPSIGGWYLAEVLDALVSNPKVWARTVLLVTWDENGGFFDHVPPPTAPPGTAGEWIPPKLLPATAAGIAGPIGLGFRVPMIVVSPFSRGGFVCHDVFDHTSILRLIERRFGVEVPNLSAWRRETTGDLTAALSLGRAPDASVPPLPPTSRAEPLGCPPDEVITPVPAYPLPATQQMPLQPAGSAPSPIA